MASYFELPAQSTTHTADGVPKEDRELRGTSMLTPQVSRILDDILSENKSSNSDEDSQEDNSSGSENDEESRFSDDDTKIDNSLSRRSRQAPSGTANIVHSPKASTKSGSKESKNSVSGTRGDKVIKHPRSHMARFQSLRSTLFQANIESSMMKCHQEAEAREQAATNWKTQHEKRQGYNRPHTPERVPEKDGFGRRIGTKIRRLTSKEKPSMGNIEENTGNQTRRESTATDDEDEPHGDSWQPRQSYESSIDHSDVDELVRWISRRDPPSDGERREFPADARKKEDSAHESLGHSDIEELVRHASRRKSIATEPVVPTMHPSYSDESTASDSELSKEEDDQQEASAADSLSRWVSRRDGAMAGPIRGQLSAPQIEPDTGNDSDVPEIGRWKTHHDDTSGESLTGSAESEVAKKDDVSVLEAARGRSRERSPKFEDKGHLKDQDVDELVRWISRRDSKGTNTSDSKDQVAQLRHQEDQKTQKLGMTIDDTSLNHEDLDDLLAHIRGRQTTGLDTSITPAHV